MEKLSEVKKEMKWEFIGSEKEFEKNIVEHMEEILNGMGLPPLKIIEQQKQIRFSGGQIIMDILVKHTDGTLTIFEVKKQNNKNPHTSPHDQMGGIGQLLLYGNLVEARTKIKPRLILLDNKIHIRTLYAFKDNNLPITLMELQKDRVFIPYKAY